MLHVSEHDSATATAWSIDIHCRAGLSRNPSIASISDPRQPPEALSVITTAVLDIEGTTSSTAYVRDKLFPYSLARICDWVAQHRDQPGTRAILEETRTLAGKPHATDDDLTAILHQWAEDDNKVPPLKTLQGWIWQEGFAAAELQGHVYPDTPEALRSWTSQGISTYVYSSGSIAAQKAWFRNSQAGDLLPCISGHFDLTNAGPKQDVDSYQRIARRLRIAPHQIIFLSDVVAELDAARAAGWHTVWVRRPEEAHTSARTASGHCTVARLPNSIRLL